MSSRLDPCELEALMQAISDGRSSPPAPEPAASPAGPPVVRYDLTSQDRIVRAQMPTVDAIDRRIASLAGGLLRGRLRIDVTLNSTPAVLMKYGEVQGLLEPARAMGLVTLGPGHGVAMLVMESRVARGLVAGALGDRQARAGDDARPGVAAELTAIERRVLARVLALVTGAFGEAWSGVLPLSPELLRVECDPRLAAIGAPSDLTLVCRFDLAGVVRGPLHVLIPYAVIEPVRKALSAPPRALGDVDARATAALARGLARAEVAVHAEVGRAKLSFSQVLGLKVGDVVTLDQREDAPVPVYVQGRRKMTAWPRVLGGQVGLVIERGVEKR